MLAGVVCCALCMGAGAWQYAQLMMRARQLHAWQEAIIAMRASAVHACTMSADTLRAGNMGVLRELAKDMERTGTDAAAAFSAQKIPWLTTQEKDVLCAALRSISNGQRAEQEAMLGYAQERFKAFCASADQRRERDAQMYLQLGALTGVCALLIFM